MKTRSVVEEHMKVPAGLEHGAIRQFPPRRSETFEVEVSGNLKVKYDALLKPGTLSGPASSDTVRELPHGYAILVNLYKDIKFMNEVRWSGDKAINEYLYEKHPDVIKYLHTNRLRIAAEIVGTKPEEKFAISESADAKTESSVCFECTNTAIGTATSETHQETQSDVETISTAVATSEHYACVTKKGTDSVGRNFSVWSRKPPKITV